MKGIEQWFWMIFGAIAAMFLLASFARMYMGIVEEQQLKSQVQQFTEMASSFSILCAAQPESADELVIGISDRVFAIYVSPSETRPPLDARRLMTEGKRAEGEYLCIQLRPVNRREPVCRKLCRMNMSYIIPPPEETVLSRALKLLGRESRFEWRVRAERLPSKINITACMRGEGC